MKIYLDNNLGVEKVEQEELTQDTYGYNILKVYIPNAVLTPYDTFTCYYGALLQNGRKVGWFAMEARTSSDADYEANYTLYKATLEQCVVSVEGKVYIGCQVLLGNSGNATLIKKNTAVVQFNVRKSVAINNDILVLDTNQTNTDVLESYKQLLENALTTYATKATTYTKTEVDGKLALKADKSNTYTKQESDNKFAPKTTAVTHTGNQLQDYSGNNIYPNIDTTIYYNKTQIDGKLDLKADKSKLTQEINNVHDIIASYGNLVVSIIVGFIRSNNGGVVSSPWANANYVCAEANVKAGTYIAANYNWIDNSFGMFADAQGNVIGRADTYKDTSKGDYIYLVPNGATKLYFSSNVSTGTSATIYQNYGYVVLEREEEITQPNRFGIDEYPYGKYVKFKTDNLFVGNQKFSDYMSEFISSSYMVYSSTNLSNLNDAPSNSIGCFLIPSSTPSENLPTNYPAQTIIKGTGLLITILSSNSGLKTQTYLSIVSGLSWNRVWTTNDGWSVWNKINLKNIYTCKKSNGDFDNLVTAINTVCQEMDATLYVGEGTWDIIDELGTTYIESVDNHQMGLVLKNRVHIICSSRAKIVCKYTGTNASTREWLSAFNAGEYGFTLENAYIETDNIRYTVHDDRGESTDNYENKYINCFMKHTNGFYEQCIGGGLGINGYIVVKGCKFITDKTTNSYLVSWHNSADGAWTDATSQGAQSFLEIKDCYFTEKGSIHLINFGKSQSVSQVLINNNSLGSAISKTNGSLYYYDNIEITSWNNEIRS